MAAIAAIGTVVMAAMGMATAFGAATTAEAIGTAVMASI